MSGHSKWAQIKYKKAITDAKKGKIFSKLARIISLAAREKGGDPETNAKLRLAIEQARNMNMPKENIERAIKRGIGEAEGLKMEEITYEAYGPGGIAIILEGVTDNKNRTLSEIKHILSQHQGKLADSGSVLWMFERKGALETRLSESPFKTKEEIELAVIDSGADDFYWREEDILEIYTQPGELEKVKKNLEDKKIKIESISLDWVAKNPITIKNAKDKEQIEKLFEALDNQDDINQIFSNLKES